MSWLDVRTVAVTVLGHPLSWVELVGTATYLWSVWLMARPHVLTWPVGIVSVLLYLLLFWQVRLYSDAVEQVYYLGASLYGWRRWTAGPREGPKAAAIRLSSRATLVFEGLLVAAGTLALGAFVSRAHELAPALFPEPASYPWVDALTTVASFLAMALLALKRLESWAWWLGIVLDLRQRVAQGRRLARGDAADGPLRPAARRGCRAPLRGLRRRQRHHAGAVDRRLDARRRAARAVHAVLRQPRLGHRDVPRGAGRAQGRPHDPPQPGPRALARGAGRRGAARAHRRGARRRAARPLGAARRRRRGVPVRGRRDDAVGPGDARGARLPAGAGARRAVRQQHPAPRAQAGGRRSRQRDAERGHRDPRRGAAHVRARPHEGEHPRGGPEARRRAAVLVQGRRLLDVPLPSGGRRGRHGRQLRVEDYEVARGFVLACQSYPASDRVP